MAGIRFANGKLDGQWVELSDTDITLGRHSGCDIIIPDRLVSSRHASIRLQDKQWWIYDLDSSNGMYIDGERSSAAVLREGTSVLLGETAFVFTCDKGDGREVLSGAGLADKSAFASQATGKFEKEAGQTATVDRTAANKAPGRDRPATSDREELNQNDIEIVEELNRSYNRMREQIGRMIVGQAEVIEQVLVCILCRGHGLLIGVPGLAKTLLVSTLSQVLDMSFKRIQFTPDLMPSDITGTDVLDEEKDTGKRRFRFMQGPLFANMVLADEINRTPPKTQAALLEAMQEHMVTVGERSYHLPEPFFVLATQNPIEQEGTYPLPEAQLDRFMFNIIVDYPGPEEELAIIQQVTGTHKAELEVVLGAEDVLKLQQVVQRVPTAEHVVAMARDLTRATRPKEPEAPEFVREMVAWGAGPRAGICLVLAAKAYAILQGRCHATTADVIKAAPQVLRHRILTTFNAEAAGVTSEDIIEQLIKEVELAPDIDV